jgi:hypothetical protein
MSEPDLAMDQAEQEVLRSTLSSAKFYLEFGCGGSTIAALQTSICRMVSVESDPHWITKMRGSDGIKHAEKSGRLVFHHIDLGPVGDWGIPTDESGIKRWHKYYTRPFFDHDIPLDVVLVDGRFRVNCMIAAAIFLPATAKVLIHDYDRRDWYFVVEKYFEIITASSSLYVMRRKETLNYRALFLDLLDNQFNYR